MIVDNIMAIIIPAGNILLRFFPVICWEIAIRMYAWAMPLRMAYLDKAIAKQEQNL